MGTYTANYQLYMPSIGETGWGELMNGNLTTIDTTMKGLDTRLTIVENEVNGDLSCTTITTTGNITVGGELDCSSFNGVVLKESGTYTVTPVNDYFFVLPRMNNAGDTTMCILPCCPNCRYTGSITLKAASSGSIMRYWDGSKREYTALSVGTSEQTFEFTDLSFLAAGGYNVSTIYVGSYKLS